MNVNDYRTETTAKLVKLDERQISIFKTLQRIEKHLEKLKFKCLKYKIDLVYVDINEGFDKILTSYLLKRQKMF